MPTVTCDSDRDSMTQVRVGIGELVATIEERVREA